ncbi:MAG: hypothetical protein H0U27_13480 [Nitrosopumilus sp.]|nr:hypothetical protein [Nitrosopumilus sp.]
MKTTSFKINNTKIWITIQPLYCFQKDTRKLKDDKGFLCYFNLSVPIYMMEGELIRDEHKVPKLFLNEAEVELYAMKYVKQRMGL